MRVFTFLLLLILGIHARADINSGILAYIRGDYDSAREEFQVAAEAGDGQAKKNLTQLKQILGDRVLEGEARSEEIRTEIMANQE